MQHLSDLPDLYSQHVITMPRVKVFLFAAAKTDKEAT